MNGTAKCLLPGCGWATGPQPAHDIAGWLATWHVYEEHPETWRAVAGNRVPVDPDPRKVN